MSSKFLVSAPIFVLLAGCNAPYKNIGQQDPFVGEAVRYNAAIQTINPDPIYPEGGAEPGDNGDRGAEAVKRYRNGEFMEKHKTDSRQNTGQSTTGASANGPQ
jgi:hypothetical protein